MAKLSTPGAVLTAMLVLGSASALTQTSEPPRNTPASRAHQQAQLTNERDACASLATKAWSNPGLHIQQNSPGTVREVSRELLRAAKTFGEAGNEAQCWHWYDRYENMR
jgi:hypothetical protein